HPPLHPTGASVTPPAATTPAHPVQRIPVRAPGRTIGALAAAASATVASTLGHFRSPSSQQSPAQASTQPPPHPPSNTPPPPYEPPPSYGAATTPPGGHPPHTPAARETDPPPAYTAVPAGGFDPRELTDFQLDELVHRIIGRVTRLVRTELRMDRERVGRLRDPRA
ncbi:extensin, partial [Streptomyces mutabilis]|uniref:extensin n=1 Tax=Streptomyces mutabilis TaxID=67332 RepID=UPI0022BA251A